MKNIYSNRSKLLALFFVFITSILTACGGGSGNTVIDSPGLPLTTTAASAVTIGIGASSNYVINGGGGGDKFTSYTATSSNVKIAAVSVSGTQLTISGVASGTATISVFDSKGASVQIAVTIGTPTANVALFTTAPSAVTIAPSTVSIYQIGGGTAPYTASSSDTSVVTVDVSQATLGVKGVAQGTAKVVVFDATGASVTISANINSTKNTTPLYTTAQSAITVAPGSSSTYMVAGGVAPYTVSSSNSGIATGSVLSDGSSLVIAGISAGTSTISVYDAIGTSAKVTVTVGATGAALYTTAPNPLNVGVGATTYQYAIAGGVAPYTVNSSNTAVAAVTASTNTISITGVSSGVANIVIFDAAGTSVKIALTVGTGNSQTVVVPVYTSAQNAITISTGANPTYTVGGGIAPYTVTSSNTSVATATLAGNSLTVTGVSGGMATVTVRDYSGGSTTITVTVGSSTALYSTAPSAVTITAGSAPGYTISGGAAPYTAVSSNPSVAQVSLVGSALTIKGVASGTAQIAIHDVTGTLVTIAVTVP